MKNINYEKAFKKLVAEIIRDHYYAKKRHLEKGGDFSYGECWSYGTLEDYCKRLMEEDDTILFEWEEKMFSEKFGV